MDKKINTIITYSIMLIWGLLIVFGFITFLSPDWLSELSVSGKNVEAISLKNHGDNFLKQKKYNLAISQYIAALEIVPELKSAIANLAITYQKIGKFNKAIISFKHLLTLKPEYPGIIYYNLGEIYEKTNQPKKAIIYFTKAADISAFPEKSYQKAGQIYMEQKDWENAIINFKLAVVNKKTIENSYKGMLLTNQRAYTDTSEIFLEIEKTVKTNSYINNISKYDNKVFIEQLNSDIDLAKTYNNIGYCLAIQENYNEAKGYLEKAIKISPSYNEAINNLKVVKAFLEQ